MLWWTRFTSLKCSMGRAYNIMGHSSHGDLRSVLKVLESFSNFYHQFVSMKGINTENLSPIPFLLQFLEMF